ncbi:MAG TPA: roadblock/LC7 domain-containing protein [Anaerolineales bacterium]
MLLARMLFTFRHSRSRCSQQAWSIRQRRFMEESRVTRQSELMRVLNAIAQMMPHADWVALVDRDGLIVACVPSEPEVDAEGISAMTAASVMMGERVLGEIDGGKLRYASIAGSERQQLTVVLGQDHLLSIGLKPEVPAQATFAPLSRWVPELLQALKRSFLES